ncbi:MAG: hypothetical protein ACPGJS_09340 [Flammeovirgaceae bacterium]
MGQKTIFGLADKFEVSSPLGDWMPIKTKQLSRKRAKNIGASTPDPTTALGDDYYGIFQDRLVYLGTDGGESNDMRFVAWKGGQMSKWTAVKSQLGDDLSKITKEADLQKLRTHSSIIKIVIPNDQSEADFFEELFDKGAAEELKDVEEHAVDIYFDPKDVSLNMLVNITPYRGHNFILGKGQKELRAALNRKDVYLVGNVHTHNAADNYDELLGKENNQGRSAETQREGDGKMALNNRIAVFSIDSESIIKHPPFGVQGMASEAPTGTKVTAVSTSAFFSGKTSYSLVRDVLETSAEKEEKQDKP